MSRLGIAAEGRARYVARLEEDTEPGGPTRPLKLADVQEATRRSLLPWLLVPYAVSVGVILTVAVMDLVPEQPNRDLLMGMFLSVTNLASAAVGFYFGGRRA